MKGILHKLATFLLVFVLTISLFVSGSGSKVVSALEANDQPLVQIQEDDTLNTTDAITNDETINQQEENKSEPTKASIQEAQEADGKNESKKDSNQEANPLKKR